jgi:hypothetical protein
LPSSSSSPPRPPSPNPSKKNMTGRMRWGRAWREGRRRRRHTHPRAHQWCREGARRRGDGGALELEGKKEREETREDVTSRSGVRRSCWKHAWDGVCWARFDPTPEHPNTHMGQVGEGVLTRGLGCITGQYTPCQTKPNEALK